MEIIQLLKMSTDEGRDYGKRFFKFFYRDKFYLIDNLKVDVLFRILKIQIQKSDLRINGVDFEMVKDGFIKNMDNKNIFDEYNISIPEFLDLVSQFQTGVIGSRNKSKKKNEMNKINTVPLESTRS